MPARARQRKRNVRFSSRKILVSFLIFSAVLLTIGGFLRVVFAWESRIWKGESRITFVVATNPSLLVSYQASVGEVSIIPFPQDLEVTGAFGAGKWSISSLYEFGKLRGMGGIPLAKSIQYEMSLPVDGWLDEKGVALLGSQISREIKRVRKDINTNYSFTASVFSGAGNLSLFDRLRIARVLSELQSGKFRIIVPEKVGMVERVRFPDGKLGFAFSKEKTRAIVLAEFQDALVASEQIGVGIVNASEVSGAGSSISEVVRTLGARVIWIRTEKEDISGCKLLVSEDEKNTNTVERLRQLFSCSVEANDDDSASVELIFGESFAREIPNLR